MAAESLSLAVNGVEVSALWLPAPGAEACFVFAHGAGAGMMHPFMSAFAVGLAQRRIATLRYQFPYMQKKSGRPDPPAVCHATVRAAVEAAARLSPLKLIAGGKSFGGRMTSQAQASGPLPGVRGLAFLGFPLHAAGNPSNSRGEHLLAVDIPMLFLQGEKDRLAELDLLRPLIQRLGAAATLVCAPEADHSFHVPKRSGRTDAEIMTAMLDAFGAWAGKISSPRS
jgi:uncharacterized protein